jgi:hypothetical protein
MAVQVTDFSTASVRLATHQGNVYQFIAASGAGNAYATYSVVFSALPPALSAVLRKPNDDRKTSLVLEIEKILRAKGLMDASVGQLGRFDPVRVKRSYREIAIDLSDRKDEKQAIHPGLKKAEGSDGDAVIVSPPPLAAEAVARRGWFSTAPAVKAAVSLDLKVSGKR